MISSLIIVLVTGLAADNQTRNTKHRAREGLVPYCADEHVAQINQSRPRSTSTEHVVRITGTDYITLENAHAARTHIHRVRGECGIGTEIF